ncbi:ABC transporter permease [Paenibacillus yonginensis]|uniref:ABC transporter permease n=1 Tax=Paenibacillus yonginensis TaxID=1462996 RepID=A0A1B1N020_9BACL|nr:ABC transporter permease [Paenibacillus yonginensis]ANS74758.1 ABC transporter permease [Paenibacillus yonginensis]
MNILRITRKELLIQLRNKQTFLFMIAFPIVLILILGSALTNAFSAETTVDSMKLLYRDNAQNAQLKESWKAFSEVLKQEGVELTALPSGTDGKQEVQDDLYTGYAELDDNGIHYYGSSQHQIENNIVQSMLSVYADRYNLAAAAIKIDPASVQPIVAGVDSFGDFIPETSLNKEKQPGSIDYYAIAMSTMIALYASMSSTTLIQGEHSRRTSIRLSASPVSKGEIFAGKVIGATLINFVCVMVVVLFSGLVFGADWGSHYGAVALVLLTLVALSVSLGLFCGYLFKEASSGRTFIVILIQVFSFIGGAYFPVGDDFSGHLALISPLRWANQALNQIIYADQASAALPVAVFNMALVAVFLILSGIYMRRQEAL